MNHVFYSGYLSITEVKVRCRLLNKSYYVQIGKMIMNSTSILNTVFFYNKGQRAMCCKCHKKRTVRHDPFQWVLGLRCQLCMPKTLCYTRAARLFREKKKNADVLKRIRNIRKLSPYGKYMTVFLYADIIVSLNFK